MSIGTPLLAMLLCALVHAQDAQFVEAVNEINQVFRNHRFDPSIMAEPFDRRLLEPRIIEIEWDGVRRHVEETLNARLNAGIRPISLPCVFRPLRAEGDHANEPAMHMMPVFVVEKGNDRAKAALKLALGLRDDALWDYEPATGRVSTWHTVAETVTAMRGDFNPRYLTKDGLDLVQIHIALQDVISRDDNDLKVYRFQMLPAQIVPGKGLRVATVWKPRGNTRFIAFGWRIKVILEKNDVQHDTWQFTTKVELGRRYASQADYSVVSDSQNGDFTLLSENMHIRFEKGVPALFRTVGKHHPVETIITVPNEPNKAEVPPPIERITAEQASPMENFVGLLTDLCSKKLLRSETTP
jgi:hypothetical protein